MNSIGVDFKLKNIDVEGKNIKLQIVIFNLFTLVGHSRAGKIPNDHDKLL